MIVLILYCDFRNATTMLRPVTTLVPRILLGDDHGQTYSGNCSFIWSREHPWPDAYARDDAPFILGRRTHLNVGNKLTICRYWCCYCWANCYCATISSVSISGSFVLFMISLSSRSLKTKRSLYRSVAWCISTTRNAKTSSPWRRGFRYMQSNPNSQIHFKQQRKDGTLLSCSSHTPQNRVFNSSVGLWHDKQQ